MAQDSIVIVDTVDKYNRYCGFETLHPLVSVVDLKQAKRMYPECKLHFGLYSLWLKNGTGCTLRYGRREYDYQDGTVVCFAPGQVVQVVPNDGLVPTSIGILFHPDLIHGTSLGRKIDRYTYFSYSESEALHLSLKEREQFLNILEEIKAEMNSAIDRHSKEVLCDLIELLLDKCLRFYDRQFITREKVNGDLLVDFERYLKAYYMENRGGLKGFPTVAYFADKLCLSTGYFGDLIKKETGMTAQAHIQNRVINMSKQELLNSDHTVNDIAWKLGFEYPQHFTRLFKKVVGMTPTEFRQVN